MALSDAAAMYGASGVMDGLDHRLSPLLTLDAVGRRYGTPPHEVARWPAWSLRIARLAWIVEEYARHRYDH